MGSAGKKRVLTEYSLRSLGVNEKEIFIAKHLIAYILSSIPLHESLDSPSSSLSASLDPLDRSLSSSSPSNPSSSSPFSLYNFLLSYILNEEEDKKTDQREDNEKKQEETENEKEGNPLCSGGHRMELKFMNGGEGGTHQCDLCHADLLGESLYWGCEEHKYYLCMYCWPTGEVLKEVMENMTLENYERKVLVAAQKEEGKGKEKEEGEDLEEMVQSYLLTEEGFVSCLQLIILIQMETTRLCSSGEYLPQQVRQAIQVQNSLQNLDEFMKSSDIWKSPLSASFSLPGPDYHQLHVLEELVRVRVLPADETKQIDLVFFFFLFFFCHFNLILFLFLQEPQEQSQINDI